MNALMFLLVLGALEWRETTFEDFRDGSTDPMMYTSHRAQYEVEPGCVEFYARWDADNNGFYDLFVAGRSSYGQKLFMGQSGASYDVGHTITYLDCQPYSGDASGGIDLADLNMDGYPEAIHSGGWYSPAAYLYWGTPTGPSPSNPTLLPMRTNYGNCHETAFVYDIDKDGYLDITVCGGTGTPSQNYTRIFWGDETFLYSVYTELPSGIGCQHNLEMADLDHDGWVDMIIPNYGTTNASIVHWSEGRNYSVETLSLSLLGGTSLHGLTIADFNKDELLDIVFTGYSNISKAVIFWGNEDGYSTANTLVLNAGQCYGGSSSMDIDSDGDLDIIFHRNGSSTTYPRLYLNLGESPYFKDSNHPDTCRNLGNVPVNGTGGFTADFNYDGNLDIFLNAHQSGNPFTGQSPILWGPHYTNVTFLPHQGYDHHGVFREPGNVYDRSFSAWYYSSVFDCGEDYDRPKEGLLDYIGYEPTGSRIAFSMRSGPDSIPDIYWSKWYPVENGYADPRSLTRRYVQYRAEFSYQRPSWLPWLEEIGISFRVLNFGLKLWPDSVTSASPTNYADYKCKLWYMGDNRDSFHLNIREDVLKPDWRIEFWDTLYLDTIPHFIKLDGNMQIGKDTAFIARIFAPQNAIVGDSNITIVWTKTRYCSKDMKDSVMLITRVAAPGVLETRIVQPAHLEASTLSNTGVIKFFIPTGEKAKLVVYDASGRRIYGTQIQGSGQIEWSTPSTASGLYFVRLEGSSETIVKKVVLTK